MDRKRSGSCTAEGQNLAETGQVYPKARGLNFQVAATMQGHYSDSCLKAYPRGCPRGIQTRADL